MESFFSCKEKEVFYLALTQTSTSDLFWFEEVKPASKHGVLKNLCKCNVTAKLKHKQAREFSSSGEACPQFPHPCHSLKGAEIFFSFPHKTVSWQSVGAADLFVLFSCIKKSGVCFLSISLILSFKHVKDASLFLFSCRYPQNARSGPLKSSLWYQLNGEKKAPPKQRYSQRCFFLCRDMYGRETLLLSGKRIFKHPPKN